LTADQTSEAAWFVDRGGRPHRGAAAIARAFAQISPLFVPLRWLYALPGLKQIADALYSWVAKNRHRMPGASAACEVPRQKAPPGSETH
jgi:predicted DCC family thiol-disulfide oxidoreductase YuxK